MATVQIPSSVLSAIDVQIRRAGVSVSRRSKALAELFELFTVRRSHLSRFTYLDSPRHRLAYLSYHLPLNLARATCVLRDLLRLKPEVASYEHVVDLGAGPGSGSLATLLTLPSAQRSYLLTDRSRGGLRLAREVIDHCHREEELPRPEVATRVQRLPELPSIPPRSLVWLSMVLNEMQLANRRGPDPVQFIRRLEAGIKPPGILIIVEPALRAPGLRLLEVHDALLGSRGWKILAPCTHQKTCPLLREKGRPWCHFHFAWKAGETIEKIAAPLGLDCEKGSLSYLVAERTGPEAAKPSGRADRARVIGDPMRVSGAGKGIYVCCDGRRQTLRDPPRDARRGDVIVMGESGKNQGQNN